MFPIFATLSAMQTEAQNTNDWLFSLFCLANYHTGRMTCLSFHLPVYLYSGGLQKEIIRSPKAGSYSKKSQG